jgi:hypothetical protein
MSSEQNRGRSKFAVESGVKSGVRIGISGWNYAGWRGVFYPKGLPHRRELEFASRAFNSIESTDLSIRCNDRPAIGAGTRESREIFSLTSKRAFYHPHKKIA